MANQKTKVLFATRALESPPREGGFVILSDIAKKLSLSTNDFTVNMFSLKNSSNDSLGTEKVFSRIGWDNRVKFEFILGLYRKAHLYDIVHTAHIPTKYNSRLIRHAIKNARKSGTTFIQTITGLPKIDIPNSELKNLLWGDHIVCQSEKTYRKVKDSINNSQTCSLIVPWRPNSSVKYSEQRRRITRKKMFAGYDKIVVFPGEFDRLGVDSSFSECIKLFLKECPSSLVVFACRFDKKKTGQLIANKFPKQVRSLGSTEDIIPIIEASDLVIYPVRTMDSKFQPPLVLLEALQLKSKVLISKIVDLDKNISPSVMHEDAYNWSAFGRKMAKIVKDNEDSFSQINNYSFEIMFEKYLDIYSSLSKRIN